MRILVVEDEQTLREAIIDILSEEKYLANGVGTGDEGLYLAEQGIHDLLILDIMLPELSGLEILKQLRNKGDTTPILLLTARDSVEDKVTGLNKGADDYLVKPFAVPELLARVKALLRRRGNVGQEGDISYRDIVINAKLKQATIGELPLDLTLKEFELLEFFVLNSEQIITREQIFDRIWGFESETTAGIVDLYVHYLRKKLAPFGKDILINTVRGAGFMLKEK
ncbi:MAG: response regulator transcription factor [Sporomusa sp.]